MKIMKVSEWESFSHNSNYRVCHESSYSCLQYFNFRSMLKKIIPIAAHGIFKFTIVQYTLNSIIYLMELLDNEDACLTCDFIPGTFHDQIGHLWSHSRQFTQLFYCSRDIFVVLVPQNLACLLDILYFSLKNWNNINSFSAKLIFKCTSERPINIWDSGTLW